MNSFVILTPGLRFWARLKWCKRARSTWASSSASTTYCRQCLPATRTYPGNQNNRKWKKSAPRFTITIPLRQSGHRPRPVAAGLPLRLTTTMILSSLTSPSAYLITFPEPKFLNFTTKVSSRSHSLNSNQQSLRCHPLKRTCAKNLQKLKKKFVRSLFLRLLQFYRCQCRKIIFYLSLIIRLEK